MWIHATYVVLINKIISVDVLPDDEKVWDVGTPIGQSKDANNHIIYSGRMTAPQDQTGANFQSHPVFVSPGALVPCAVETASDEDHWSKASDGTEDTEADTINDPADYVWTGATFVTGPKREDGTYPTAVKVTGTTATLLAPQSGSVAPTCTISNTHGKTPSSRQDTAITRSVEVKILIVKVDATSDHLDADGTSQSKIRVRLVDQDNNPVALPGLAMTLKAEFPAPAQGAAAPSPGTFRDAQLISDGNGQGFADKNDNGQRDAGEDDFTLFKTGKTGGWATVTATVSQSTATKELLLHRVDVKDFGQPKLLINKDDSSGGPSLDFSIDQAPSVCQLFKVTTTIYSLSGHDPVAQKVEVLPPGAHSYAWSDFFTHDSSDGSGKPLDPGEGIYPFQVEAVALPIDKGGLDKSQLDAHSIADQTPKAGDWKASKTLTVKPKPQNAWNLSYDEDSGKTFLTYSFDVSNSRSTTPPQKVQVDVYDPEGTKVSSVTDQLLRMHVSDDGHTFTYYFRGEVQVDMAGTYHFVAEAQQVEADSEGKDAGKWALEQNSAGRIPSYAVFGGSSPGISIMGRVGAKLDTQDAAGTAGGYLENQAGYKASRPRGKRWWHQKLMGVHDTFAENLNADAIIGPQRGDFQTNQLPPTYTRSSINALTTPMQQQPIQYNAIWCYIGHGGGGRTMAVWNTGDPNDYSDPGPEHDDWTYLCARQSDVGLFGFVPAKTPACLDQLPPTYRYDYNGTAFISKGGALRYSRLVLFVGCSTARLDSRPNLDLPHTAVSLGAKSSIGFANPKNASNLVTWLDKFLWYCTGSNKLGGDQTKVADAARVAAEQAGLDPDDVRVAGDGNTRIIGADFGWGDSQNLGPEPSTP